VPARKGCRFLQYLQYEVATAVGEMQVDRDLILGGLGTVEAHGEVVEEHLRRQRHDDIGEPACGAADREPSRSSCAPVR
jgi:hypothetical protein